MESIEDTKLEKRELPLSVQRSRREWERVVTAVLSITPRAFIRGVLVLGAITAVGWLIVSTWPALLPFLVGGVIAYAVLPLTNSLDRFMPRAFAIAIVLILTLVIFGLFLYASAVILGRQIFFLLRAVPGQAEVNILISQLDENLAGLSPNVRLTVVQTAQQLSDRLFNNMAAYYARLPELLLGGIFNLLNTLGFILGFLVIPTWLLLVLRDQQTGARTLRRILPQRWLPDVMAVWRVLDRSFRAFIEGQLVMAMFVTLFVYIGLLFLETIGVVSITFMLAAAVFAGLMQLIPKIGPIIVVVVILLTRLTMHSTGEMLAVLILYLVVEQLLRMTVEPRVQRRIVSDVHPALLIMVIVALSGFGLLWVFLAAPVTAVVRDLFLYIYGRFGEPPRPAGLLPGEKLSKRKKRPQAAPVAALQPAVAMEAASGRPPSAKQASAQTYNAANYRASQYSARPTSAKQLSARQAAAMQPATAQTRIEQPAPPPG